MTDFNEKPDHEVTASDARSRIVAAAAALIDRGGRDAATTRAVSIAAGVQAPTIYRLFGDKQGLLDAVVQHGMAAYVAEKGAREPHADPVQDLRDGWDMHVAFGLANPGLFAILSGDQRPRPHSPAMAAGIAVLQRRIRNIALAGRLRVSEGRALAMLHSVGTGTILSLLGEPEGRRDPGLSDAARDMVIATICGAPTTSSSAGHRGAAATMRALLDHTTAISSGERHLLAELLDRIADHEEVELRDV